MGIHYRGSVIDELVVRLPTVYARVADFRSVIPYLYSLDIVSGIK